MAHSKDRTQTAVTIIGAGIPVLIARTRHCMAIDLIRRNKSRDFVIIERGLQVCGAWSDNTYPGCCCDVCSHLYPFSFAPNLDWTLEYPEETEIPRYLIGVAEKWGLYRHIRFNSAASEARWNEKKHK